MCVVIGGLEPNLTDAARCTDDGYLNNAPLKCCALSFKTNFRCLYKTMAAFPQVKDVLSIHRLNGSLGCDLGRAQSDLKLCLYQIKIFNAYRNPDQVVLNAKRVTFVSRQFSMG